MQRHQAASFATSMGVTITEQPKNIIFTSEQWFNNSELLLCIQILVGLNPDSEQLDSPLGRKY